MREWAIGVTVAAAVWGLAGVAAADPVLECSLAASSQVEIGDCLARVEAAVDETLAEALGFAAEAAKGLDADTGRAVAAPALDAGQAAWVAFRDAHCEYVGSTFGGGSGTGAAIRGCRIELGRERVGVLMGFAR